MPALTPSSTVDYCDQVWIEKSIVTIVKAAMSGLPPKDMGNGSVLPAQPRNHQLALTGLMSLAKLKGYIVDRQQRMSARLDLNKLSSKELNDVLSAQVNALSPGARQQVEDILEGIITEPIGPDVDT